jgi:hypothetical protein
MSKQKDNTNYKHRAGALWSEVGKLEQARDAYLAELADGDESWGTFLGPTPYLNRRSSNNSLGSE